MEPIFSVAAVVNAALTGQPAAAVKPPQAPQIVEEPADPRLSTKRVIRRSGSGFTPSIKDAMSGKFGDEKHEEDAKEKVKYYSEELNDPFTKEQFEAKWAEYLERLNDRPNLKATLARTPGLFDGCKAKLQIDNEIQDSEISRLKPDLVSWLRKELRNTGIELITEIVETEASVTRPQTETERLNEMVRKNPNIALLKQTFNLDFGEH